MAFTIIVAKISGVLLIRSGGVCGIDGLNGREGGHVRGVAHHTHHEVTVSGIGPSIELHHQFGNVNLIVHFGQDQTGNFVGALGVRIVIDINGISLVGIIVVHRRIG